MFKLSTNGLVAVKKLKQSDEFKILLSDIQVSLEKLDKANRSLVEPNLLLKSSGKAQILQSILDSVEAV